MDSWSKFQHRNYPVMQRRDAIRTVMHAYGHGVGACREVIVVKRTVTLLTEKVSDLKASALGNLTRTMSPRKASLIDIMTVPKTDTGGQG